MPRHASGFTLIEVLVATGILVTVAAGAAQLFGIAIRHDVESRLQLAMAAAAAAKIDELAGAVAAAAATPPASGALDRAVDGCADVVSMSGFTLARRWLVAPIGGSAATAVVIVVRVVASARAAGDYEIATIAEAAAAP